MDRMRKHVAGNKQASLKCNKATALRLYRRRLKLRHNTSQMYHNTTQHNEFPTRLLCGASTHTLSHTEVSKATLKIWMKILQGVFYMKQNKMNKTKHNWQLIMLLRSLSRNVHNVIIIVMTNIHVGRRMAPFWQTLPDSRGNFDKSLTHAQNGCGTLCVHAKA